MLCSFLYIVWPFSGPCYNFIISVLSAEYLKGTFEDLESKKKKKIHVDLIVI